MFLPFLLELRNRGLKVGLQEARALAQALEAGLHESSIDGFYYVARSLLVHSEVHLDAFDEAFSAWFHGIDVEGKALRSELLEWLASANQRRDELDDSERMLVDELSLDELRKLFEERAKNQNEPHRGGNEHIGTQGTSPFGHGGQARPGLRIGGAEGQRSAMQTADARRYRPYRSDLVLDVRQMGMALRRLRAFAREGAERELDLEGTIDETARNAGEIEVVTRPPRRPNTRVILMMDVGGSMDPYAHLASRLFSATSKATHFKELRTYYFHNCVYGRVYRTDRLDEPVRVRDLLRECGRHYKLIMVGDALMAPYELLSSGGASSVKEEDRLEGLTWLMILAEHFERSVWLNPEPAMYWSGTTIEYVASVIRMYPLTLDGLGDAVAQLVRGRTR